MAEIEEQVKGQETKERDAMDGGFAVVDRERLIEDEVSAITPWYKRIVEMFTAPNKMLEECFSVEPTKGTAVGVVGCMLFSALAALLAFWNPINKTASMELFRLSGVAETQLEQKYSITMISGTIGVVIGIFINVFLTAIILHIIRAILKDKCKFSTLYKMLLIPRTVSLFVQCIDAALAIFIGVSGNVFSLQGLLANQLSAGGFMPYIINVLTLSSIIQLIYIAMGYKAVTHTNIKKGIIVVLIYQVISIFMSYGYGSFVASLMPAV